MIDSTKHALDPHRLSPSIVRISPLSILFGAALALAAAAAIGEPAPAPAPPLGWNSWDSYRAHLDEDAALANLEVMAVRLRPFGYEYFVIDGGWYREYELKDGTKYPVQANAVGVRVDDYGRFIPSKTYFPNGLKRIADRAHERGLKFGVHILRGIPREAVRRNLPVLGTPYRAADIADRTSTCPWSEDTYGIDMTKPGAQAFYDAHVALLAEYGVDFIKADDITGHPAEVEAVANAIRKTDRPILLSLSPGGPADPKHLPAYRMAQMLRTSQDIWDNRRGLDQAFDAWLRWQPYGGNGFWPDLDMIPFGHLNVRFPKEASSPDDPPAASEGRERLSRFTKDQCQTFITMRALAASPLFMGGDLLTLDDASLELITHPDVLACNQNGIPGRRVFSSDGIEVWRAPETADAQKGWLGIFNRTETARTVRLGRSDLAFEGNGAYRLRDVWGKRTRTLAKEPLEFAVGGDGVVFLRYER